MTRISDPVIRGSGQITGAFQSPDGQLLAVASQFPYLSNAARSFYSTQKLFYRLALHRRGEPTPFAVFDSLSLPINDVAFHPTGPVLAIGAGCYDQFDFPGDLILWNWQARRFHRPAAQIPEVCRVRFDASGDAVEALVQPWHEEWESPLQADGDEAPEGGFLVHISGAATANSVEIELNPDRTLSTEQATERGFVSSAIEADDPAAAVATWLGFPQQTSRRAIWDVGWLDAKHVGVVHDGCMLEIFNVAGPRTAVFEGDGHGVEILRSNPPCVHVVRRQDFSGGHFSDSGLANLYAIVDGDLRTVGSFEGRFTFSASTDGLVLGRQNRLPPRDSSADILITLADGAVRKVQLGHYDAINHYVGIDGAPDLYFLQGNPPSSHKNKRLAVVQPTGQARALWPLLPQDGTDASHAMHCCGCFVDDSRGEGMVVSGMHYSPSPLKPADCFLYRRDLKTGWEVWRHARSACASAVVFVPDEGLVVVALLDGGLILLRASDGEVQFDARARIDGVPTVITCMDSNEGRLAIGTIDGRILVMSISDIRSAAAANGWFDLD